MEDTREKVYQAYQEAIVRVWWTSPKSAAGADELWLTSRISCNTTANVLPDPGVHSYTNNIQTRWIACWLGDTGKVMIIVGDYDQLIYGWRGAQETIQRFLNDFPGAETIRLEQNYRWTSNILSAAQRRIQTMEGVWPEIRGPMARTVSRFPLLRFYPTRRSAFCAYPHQNLGRRTRGACQCAILYRSNAQSRALETVGPCGTVFTAGCASSNARNQDALSYLRLIANRNDDAAFERVVKHQRGVLVTGRWTWYVRHPRSPVNTLQACRELLQEKALAGRAASALQRFMELIDALAQETADTPLHVQSDRVMKDSGLRTMMSRRRAKRLRRVSKTRGTGDGNVPVQLQREERINAAEAFSPMRHWKQVKGRRIPGRMRCS
ncbi:3'-5' exonuclease [Escherichia coli]